MNEYSGLTERQLIMAMEEAEEADDWDAMSKISVANQVSSHAGMATKYQADFIDRR